MITVDEKEVLRRKVLVDGLSIREVARQNGCSRDTVKRALLDPSPSVYHMSAARKCPVMDPFREVIDNWLREDRDQPVKQRHTAHRIYDRLRAEPYNFQGGEPTVRRFVRERVALICMIEDTHHADCTVEAPQRAALPRRTGTIGKPVRLTERQLSPGTFGGSMPGSRAAPRGYRSAAEPRLAPSQPG